MSTPFRLIVPDQLIREMKEHARAELPNECCGFLAGRREDAVGRVTHRHPLVNEAASPTEFLSEARSLLTAHKEMRRHGTDILAVYHSHPHSPATPSRTDRDRNNYPDVAHIIISLLNETAEVRGWWMDGDIVRETPLGDK